MAGNISAGDLDRRIQVFRATVTIDESGDQVFTWDPPAQKFDRWAMIADAYGREIKSVQQLVRDVDSVLTLRWDSQTRQIAPENFRFMWRGTVYTIVSVSSPSGVRFDTIAFLCASRPDLQGARGREQASHQP
jgi:head-tail adaptor